MRISGHTCGELYHMNHESHWITPSVCSPRSSAHWHLGSLPCRQGPITHLSQKGSGLMQVFFSCCLLLYAFSARSVFLKTFIDFRPFLLSFLFRFLPASTFYLIPPSPRGSMVAHPVTNGCPGGPRREKCSGPWESQIYLDVLYFNLSRVPLKQMCTQGWCRNQSVAFPLRETANKKQFRTIPLTTDPSDGWVELRCLSWAACWGSPDGALVSSVCFTPASVAFYLFWWASRRVVVFLSKTCILRSTHWSLWPWLIPQCI